MSEGRDGLQVSRWGHQALRHGGALFRFSASSQATSCSPRRRSTSPSQALLLLGVNTLYVLGGFWENPKKARSIRAWAARRTSFRVESESNRWQSECKRRGRESSTACSISASETKSEHKMKLPTAVHLSLTICCRGAPSLTGEPPGLFLGLSMEAS